MSLPPSTTDKRALRQALLERRQNIIDTDRARMDAAIAAHLERWLDQHQIGMLGIFWPIRNEPDLHDLYRRLSLRKLSLALPIVTAKDSPLRFAAWAPGDPMKKDAYGVPAPEKISFVPTPDALLIPCVGFNSLRYRIGYGGGFYDRTLAIEPKPLAIGIAYSCQLAQFQTSEHDIALDLIVTEISQ